MNLDPVLNPNCLEDSDVPAIQRLARGKIQEIAQIDEELLKLKAAYEALEVQRKDASSLLARYHAELSPLRRGIVPDDILREIFLHCLPDDSVMQSSESPLLLTQVCSRWRTIAHKTPRLWASIHIAVPGPRDTSVGDPTEFYVEHSSLEERTADQERSWKKTRLIASAVADWLARAKDCSLRITIADFGPKDFERRHTDLYCGMLIGVLIPFSKQISQLFLSLPLNRPGLEDFLSLPLHSFPRLTMVDVSFQGPGHRPVPQRDVQGWLKAPIFKSPALRSVRLHQPQSVDVFSLPIAWGHLTHLSLEAVTTSDGFSRAIYILRACVNLISFYFSGGSTHPVHLFIGGGEYNHHFTLPFLKNLSFDLSAKPTITPDPLNSLSVFDQFNFPALEYIHYFWLPQTSTERCHAIAITFRRILQRWGNTLKRLATTTQSFSVGDIRSYLQHCPHLQEFVLSWTGRTYPATVVIGPESTDVFFKLLGSIDEEGHYLLPKLQVFENINENEYTDRGVLDFIRAKQTTGQGLATLRRISLKMHRPQQEPIAEALRSFIDNGCCVELEYSTDDGVIRGWDSDIPVLDITSPVQHLPILRSSYPSENVHNIFLASELF